MIKAIFLDYTGIIVQENCPSIQEMVMCGYKNSDAKSPQDMEESGKSIGRILSVVQEVSGI